LGRLTKLRQGGTGRAEVADVGRTREETLVLVERCCRHPWGSSTPDHSKRQPARPETVFTRRFRTELRHPPSGAADAAGAGQVAPGQLDAGGSSSVCR